MCCVVLRTLAVIIHSCLSQTNCVSFLSLFLVFSVSLSSINLSFVSPPSPPTPIHLFISVTLNLSRSLSLSA